MDNNTGQNKTKSEPQDTGTLPRVRSQSECSTASDDGAVGFTGKRQRTTSQQFMVTSGLTSASPPKFVTLEEIMQAANGIRDMALVHQIVVDEDFKLEKVEAEHNTLHKVIKDTVHRAFWDLLRNELNSTPPVYTQALRLLEDIREGLFALLLPQHTRLRQMISDILDLDLIKQQAENGVLNFPHYAEYVISVMAKLCAPVRDEKIKELKETVDVIDTFRGILETLDLMKLDMANFTIQMVRPDIIANSVELERKKFKDYLAIQPDGLQYTRKWLLKYVNTTESLPQDVDYSKFVKNIVQRAFFAACVDLIDWDKNTPYPETFMLDEDRLKELENKTNRLLWVATILLVTLGNAGPDLQSIAPFKESVKEHIFVLIQNIRTEEELNEVLPNIIEQILKDLHEAQNKYNVPTVLTNANEINLKNQILEIVKPDHKVKAIVKQRIKEFFADIIESSTANPQKVPSGLTVLQKELTAVAGQFLRIVSYNNTVFWSYYFDIVAEVLPKPI